MKRALGLAALLTLLAGAWWLLQGSERRSLALERPVAPPARVAASLAPAHDAAQPPALAEPSAAEAADPRDDGAARVAASAPAEEHADDALRVRVVDAMGEPLDAVSTWLEVREDAAGDDRTRFQQTTDAQGRARFDDVRARIAAAPLAWSLGQDLPAAEPPSRVLDRTALEADELVVTLPPAGRIEVRVRELDGSPAPAGSDVRLRLAGHEDRDWRRAVAGGVARFAWVEPGRSWELAAWRPQGTAPARAVVHAPVLAGESVQVELVLGADQPVVSFRAVDRAGVPFAGASLEIVKQQDFWFTTRFQVETDSAGRFLLDGTRLPMGSGGFLANHRTDPGVLLQGRASLPGEPAVGWNDGGDVVLEPEPLLCAGRVVDAAGGAVAGAEVAAGEEDHGFVGLGGGGLHVRGRSGPDGSFELRGLWDSDEFELRAERGGERSQVRAHQGEQGLVLALEPRHTLSLCLAVDEGVDASAVRFQLVPADGEPFEINSQNGGARTLALQKFLDFAPQPQELPPDCVLLDPVAGGTYALACTLDGVELLRTQPFALHGDLDLGTLDLRGRIQACEIVLRGAADPSDLRGQAFWRASGSSERHDVRFEGDRVRIQTPVLPIDVAIVPEGYRVARLEGVGERGEVELEPALRVRIALSTEGELPAAPYSFGCGLYQDDLQVGEAQGSAFFDAARREIAFECSAAGKVEVRWSLQRSFEGASFGGAIGSGVLSEHSVAIDVRDEPGEQLFTVQLDGAVLAGLMQSPPW